MTKVVQEEKPSSAYQLLPNNTCESCRPEVFECVVNGAKTGTANVLKGQKPASEI